MLNNDDKKFDLQDHEAKDGLLFPGRSDISLLEKLPKCVVFTSEFDHLRRDSLVFIDRLKATNKLVDSQDMPSVAHGYQADASQKESKWFYEDLKKCFQKYVKDVPNEKKDEEEAEEEAEDEEVAGEENDAAVENET